MALNEKTEDWLLPYLEGAYAADAARLAEIEARLAADPTLAAEAVQMRQMLDAVHGVAARTPRPEIAAVPADSWPRLKERLQPAPRRLSWAWLGGAGAAVAVAAGVLAVVLPGHHPIPKANGVSRVAVAPTVSPARPPAAKPAQKPPQVAQTAPAPTGPLVKPNSNGLSDPFLTLPVPPPLPGKAAGKTAPPVVIKSVPKPKSNPQIASRDIAPPPSPEVVRPLLPLPVPPPLAPAPAAPPLPVPPPETATAPVPQGRLGRRMFKMAVPTPAAPTPTVPPAAPGNAPAAGQVQTFSTEAPPSAAAAPPAEPYKLPPPAAALGGAGGFGGGGFGGGGFGGAGGRAMSRMAVPPRPEPTSADNAALLTAGTKSLTEAVTPPLWGKNAGMQQSNETLIDLQEAGLLDDLRAKLESRRTQMPKDVATGRMLAAVYDFSNAADAALHERQRVASLDGADGEDFFQLGQSEQRAGNADAARAAFRRALTASTPPSGFHAALARQGAQ